MSLRYILFTLLFVVLGFTGTGRDSPIKTIVIDAGHGGKDPGATGPSHVNEKDIALSVALKLGEHIQKTFPEIKIIYTRKTDEFIALHERAEIANRNKADLFISVHCNASPNGEAYGTSTYVLGLHRTEANLDVAKRENSVILMEEDRTKNYEFDPNSAEGHIIMSMKQNAFLDQSIDMASKIENQYEDKARRKSLGVKQAGFYVLYKTTMPSLLSEIGFISNSEEEKFLSSVKGQEQIAESLFNAFKQYKAGVEIAMVREANGDKPATTTTTPPETTTTAKPTTTPAPASTTTKPAAEEYITLSGGKKIKKPSEGGGGGGVLNSPKAETAPPAVKVPEKETEVTTTTTIKTDNKEPEKVVVETKTEVKTPEAVKETVTAPVAEAPKEVKTEAPKQVKTDVITEVKTPPVNTTEPEKKEVVTTEIKNVPKAEAKTPEPAKEVKPSVTTPVATKPATGASGYNFKIQLFALKGELKTTDRDKIIRLFKEISQETIASNGMTRYYAGNAVSFAEAKKMLSVAVNNGYPGAFIIGTKNGKKLTTDEIKALEAQ